MNLLRCLCVVAAFVAILPAQERPSGQGDENAMDRRMRAAKAKAMSPEKAAELIRNGKEGMTEEELNELAAAIPAGTGTGVNSAAAFCRFHAAIKPAKLLPGQSGTMIVTAVLSGQAVIPSPAVMERVGDSQRGLVTVGQPACRPAEPGRLAPAYLGRPVYDNYAVIEIPVTMAADAELGKKQTVQVDLRFDIYDGATAQLIGKFIDRASAEVEVGRALDPAVQGARGAATATPLPTIDAATGDGTTSQASTPVESTRLIAGTAPAAAGDAAVAAPRVEEATHDPIGTTDEGVGMLPLLAGGGAVLLLIFLLVARRS